MMKNVELFEVGGCVRDELLGVKSKDIDFSVVLNYTGNDPFGYMVAALEVAGVKVFRNDKTGEVVGGEHFTARGIAPKDFPVHPGRALDFVLARKEGSYSDGRRPDSVEVGTLMDDLRRRDFTMNAIAKNPSGSLYDPFGGVEDIQRKVIRAVGDPVERLAEDALRAVRALRFAVTKGFWIEFELNAALKDETVLDAIVTKISDERIDAELSKMFRFNTIESINMLSMYPDLTAAMFAGSVSLDATMKQKGRG